MKQQSKVTPYVLHPKINDIYGNVLYFFFIQSFYYLRERQSLFRRLEKTFPNYSCYELFGQYDAVIRLRSNKRHGDLMDFFNKCIPEVTVRDFVVNDAVILGGREVEKLPNFEMPYLLAYLDELANFLKRVEVSEKIKDLMDANLLFESKPWNAANALITMEFSSQYLRDQNIKEHYIPTIITGLKESNQLENVVGLYSGKGQAGQILMEVTAPDFNAIVKVNEKISDIVERLLDVKLTTCMICNIVRNDYEICFQEMNLPLLYGIVYSSYPHIERLQTDKQSLVISILNAVKPWMKFKELDPLKFIGSLVGDNAELFETYVTDLVIRCEGVLREKIPPIAFVMWGRNWVTEIKNKYEYFKKAPEPWGFDQYLTLAEILKENINSLQELDFENLKKMKCIRNEKSHGKEKKALHSVFLNTNTADFCVKMFKNVTKICDEAFWSSIEGSLKKKVN